jgi:predicted amino acid dehydrogenase
MALTDTQRTNAAILAAQGDTAAAIAHHVAAPVADVEALLAPGPKPLEKRTVAELRAYAVEHGIDLGEATKKTAILAAIAAAAPPASDNEDDETEQD